MRSVRLRASFAPLLALFALSGSGGCSIQTIAQSYPVGRIRYMSLKQYQERLDEDGVKSMADIYVSQTGKTETISEKKEKWRYVDRRAGKHEGYEMYDLLLHRSIGDQLRGVHGSIYRYWESGRERIKVFFGIEYMYGSATLTGGHVDVYVDRKNNLITLFTPHGGGRTLFGYVAKWKKGSRLF